LGIACGAQSALGSAWGQVNPASESNYFRRSAEHNGLAARIVKYADPAYMAVNGYVGAYDQWSRPCGSFWGGFEDAGWGTVGAVGTVAFAYDAVAFGGGIIEGWGTAGEDASSGVSQTAHGAERAADPSRLSESQQVVVIANATARYTQADGAEVFVQEVDGRFNVVVVGSRGVVTNLKTVSLKAVERLSSNYGWVQK
jgi:hypothetical protein